MVYILHWYDNTFAWTYLLYHFQDIHLHTTTRIASFPQNQPRRLEGQVVLLTPRGEN